ncbi:MAG: site-specific DNA-methyltransferase [Planctomycetes bacterium]|nr:site-specific DNA-methyltransferase [Planctomycetota bacterium]
MRPPGDSGPCAASSAGHPSPLARELAAFATFGTSTVLGQIPVGSDRTAPTFTNEFWTSSQREGHSLHEVSYRACFKPSLPAFFVERLSRPGELVLDPFMGRGTTPLEAALRGRVPCGNDVNPLSAMLVRPRLHPPELPAIAARLRDLELRWDGPLEDDLLVFFHPDTLREIHGLRTWLLQRQAAGTLDPVDDWIRMVAVNRLTGHSSGYFSVYTLPPNQATSPQAQRKINEKRNQVPERRDVRALVLKKSKSLLRDVAPLWRSQPGSLAAQAVLLTGPAHTMPALADGCVQLVVTSPPFLDVVQYATDNWLRCWFCGIDAATVPITMARTVPAWQQAMGEVFCELFRVVRRGGWVAFEVGEVKGGTVRLEEAVLPVAAAAGFEPELVMINAQEFTKTANCWGVDNNEAGTNTNRIVVLRRP